MSRKTGVMLTNGSVKDKGESLIAFINNKEVIVFSNDEAMTAIQNVWFTGWKEWFIKASGRIIKIEKNLCAQVADSTSIFWAPLLLKALNIDSKKALRNANINHIDSF